MSGRGQATVKDKSAASQQITAEQILREAWERQDVVVRPPSQKITDADELEHFRLTKRKSFEDNLRRQRHNVGVWLRYGLFEAEHGDFARARSVFERALDVDYRNVSIWMRYAEMEMKAKFVARARNVMDRAMALLPRVDQLWYKRVHMEEMLGNVDEARAVFERWMNWAPARKAWKAYVAAELRHKRKTGLESTLERCRNIYERFVRCHNDVDAYLDYAKFEEKYANDPALARSVFERCSEELPEYVLLENDKLFSAMASFEERYKEFERARAIYKYALERLSKSKSAGLYARYISFEKMHGDRGAIDDVVLSKSRAQYEARLASNAHDYDTWFDYIRLEISACASVPDADASQGEDDSNSNSETVPESSLGRIRDVFERAVAAVPPLKNEKQFWLRYIYIWIRYFCFEELNVQSVDPDRVRALYRTCLDIIPHEHFTFAKIWRMAAEFELRNGDLSAARAIFGCAVGRTSKESLFAAYIEMELQVGAVDRCRTLYRRWLETSSFSCSAWTGYAELETSLGENARARSLYELAVSQPLLDRPEVLWRAYIDFEMAAGDSSASVRALYDRLLERTKHVKVWISKARFEVSITEFALARQVFKDAERYFKAENSKEERVLILEAWKEFESRFGDAASQKAVEESMPKRLKKRRLLTDENGAEAGWEEYIDYEFPDEQKGKNNLKLLEKARAWKRQKQMQSSDN